MKAMHVYLSEASELMKRDEAFLEELEKAYDTALSFHKDNKQELALVKKSLLRMNAKIKSLKKDLDEDYDLTLSRKVREVMK